MYLEQLILTQFKNYRTQAVSWSPYVNALTGLNGMGKTNMLEAIYYLCMCKSCRNLSDQRLPTHEERFFRLEGEFVNQEGESAKVVAKMESRKSKVFEWNGVAYDRLADHIGKLPIVALLPSDTQIALGGSEERRRFFNNAISQIDHQYLEDLLLYNRLLQRRNATLKQFQNNKQQLSLLDTYDHQMQSAAERIFAKRVAFSKEMLPVFSQFYQHITQKQEEASYVYSSDLHDTDWHKLMNTNRQKDILLQRTTVGIHRDDWAFSIRENAVKQFASQGQLKSFVISLKLAQYQMLRQHKSNNPIILLDDLFDRLDAQRALQLMRLLHEQSFGQIFITDTDENRIRAIVSPFQQDYASFKVVDGEVR